MAQTAGIYYVNGAITGACKALAADACAAASNTWSTTYGCYNGSTYRHPSACLIGTVDVCPTVAASSDPFQLLTIDSGLLAYMFGSALLFWCIGLGLGLMVSMIRKVRL